MGNLEFYAIDMLKERAPQVDMTFHLDKAYFKFNFPSFKSSFQLIHRVNYRITEYGSLPDGSIDKTNIIDSFNRTFYPSQIIGAVNKEGLPLHDAWFGLNKSWYEFRFEYSYYPFGNTDGSNIWYSLPSIIQASNLIPRVYEKMVGLSIIGDLKAALIDSPDHNISLWYDRILNDIPEEELANFDDIKIKDSVSFMQLKYDKPTDGFTLEMISKHSMIFWNILLYNEGFLRVISEYDNQAVFLLRFNQMDYTITIKGDLRKLVEDYWNEDFGTIPVI